MPFAARANLRLTAHSGAFRVVEVGELCGGRAGLEISMVHAPLLIQSFVTASLQVT